MPGNGRAFVDLTGKTFGGNLIVERGPNSKYGAATWLRLCQCGNTTFVSKRNVSSPCIACAGIKKRKPDGDAAFKAKAKEVKWTLLEQDFRLLTKGNCYWCGIGPKQISHAKSQATPYIYNGVDRLDPSAGYVVGNCVSCCKVCNRAKSDLSVADFQEWIARLVSKRIAEEETCAAI